MSKVTVDSESLGEAASALGKYISEIESSISKMNDAATDCSDNMGNDVYSQKAITKLQSCSKSLKKTIEEAKKLQQRILRKKQEIEESGSQF